LRTTAYDKRKIGRDEGICKDNWQKRVGESINDIFLSIQYRFSVDRFQSRPYSDGKKTHRNHEGKRLFLISENVGQQITTAVI